MGNNGSLLESLLAQTSKDQLLHRCFRGGEEETWIPI